jgi:hypothetical protein
MLHIKKLGKGHMSGNTAVQHVTAVAIACQKAEQVVMVVEPQLMT